YEFQFRVGSYTAHPKDASGIDRGSRGLRCSTIIVTGPQNSSALPWPWRHVHRTQARAKSRTTRIVKGIKVGPGSGLEHTSVYAFFSTKQRGAIVLEGKLPDQEERDKLKTG